MQMWPTSHLKQSCFLQFKKILQNNHPFGCYAAPSKMLAWCTWNKSSAVLRSSFSTACNIRRRPSHCSLKSTPKMVVDNPLSSFPRSTPVCHSLPFVANQSCRYDVPWAVISKAIFEALSASHNDRPRFICVDNVHRYKNRTQRRPRFNLRFDAGKDRRINKINTRRRFRAIP